MRQQFSIAIRLVAACAALVVLRVPIATGQDLQLAPDAPQRYTVQRGDTLWGISGKFLKEPWRWPEVWRMNREQIKNPHWIYPGDVVVLDRSSGAPQLRLERGGQIVAQPGRAATAPPAPTVTTPARPGPTASPPASLPTVRLSPSIRSMPLDLTAIPSIPPTDLDPFLVKPLVTGPEGLSYAPEIIAGRDTHVVRGDGDVIYATGVDRNAGDLWYIYRPGRTFRSGDDAKSVLGYEQRYLGTARLERVADVSSLRISMAKEEIHIGDRLIPAPRGQLINYAPHPPTADIRGNVIAVENASSEAGVGWVVTLDKGAQDGIDVGTVLATYRSSSDADDPRAPPSTYVLWNALEKPTLRLPEERTGLIFVFLVFDRVSYAIALRTTDPILAGHFFRTP